MKAKYVFIAINWIALGLIMWQTNWIVAIAVALALIATLSAHSHAEHK
jgi:hypothetical protein